METDKYKLTLISNQLICPWRVPNSFKHWLDRPYTTLASQDKELKYSDPQGQKNLNLLNLQIFPHRKQKYIQNKEFTGCRLAGLKDNLSGLIEHLTLVWSGLI